MVRPGQNLGNAMKKQFRASLWCEGAWVVAECLDLDVASQGRSEEEALTNLKETLELHFEAPCATTAPTVRDLEVEVGAA